MNSFVASIVMTSVQMGKANSRRESNIEVDDRVVERFRTGDPEAFEAVIRAHDPAFRMLAARLVGDIRTDDILQEAYLRAFRAIGRHRGPTGSVPAWLWRIVYHTCIDELRRVRREPTQSLDDGIELAGPGPEEVATDRARLTAALAGLTSEQRAAVVLVDALGFDYSEASSILGIRRGTVASRLSQARAALRRVLSQHDDLEPD